MKSMKTIMIEKICSELPDMYIMMAFMGMAFAGARAMSHDFLSLSVSVASAVGTGLVVDVAWEVRVFELGLER